MKQFIIFFLLVTALLALSIVAATDAPWCIVFPASSVLHLDSPAIQAVAPQVSPPGVESVIGNWVTNSAATWVIPCNLPFNNPNGTRVSVSFYYSKKSVTDLSFMIFEVLDGNTFQVTQSATFYPTTTGSWTTGGTFTIPNAIFTVRQNSYLRVRCISGPGYADNLWAWNLVRVVLTPVSAANEILTCSSSVSTLIQNSALTFNGFVPAAQINCSLAGWSFPPAIPAENVAAASGSSRSSSSNNAVNPSDVQLPIGQFVGAIVGATLFGAALTLAIVALFMYCLKQQQATPPPPQQQQQQHKFFQYPQDVAALDLATTGRIQQQHHHHQPGSVLGYVINNP